MGEVLVLGIDISNHQGKAGMDLDKVLTKNPGIKVVIIKSSEGTNYDDAYDEKFIQIALAHGCIVGVYHFARPDRNAWLAEARFFMSLTLKWKGKVFYILDWERDGSTSWAKSFLDYVKEKTGSTPMFYSYESRINAQDFSAIAHYPLWVARYRDYEPDKNFDMSKAGKAPSVKWWKEYIAWQWTSVGRLTGYSGNLDCNVFYIDEAELRSYIGSAGTAPASTVKTFPVTDPVRISNSGSDEHGNYRGGTAGDNSGKEWYIRDWYNRPWNCVLRHPDPEVRACLADLAIKAAENDRIGYDQNQRNTYWTQLQKAGYDPSKITVACEADCSAGVIANVKAAGYILGRKELQTITCTYTGNMRAGLKAAGFQVLTASKSLTGSSYLVAGDIILNDVHHVATAVTNGKNSGQSGSQGASQKVSGGVSGGTVKTDAELAVEVILGLHGNGDIRKQSLGSRYAAVQKLVNQYLENRSTMITAMAQYAIKGYAGNGDVRKRFFGSYYSEVQKKINQLLK